MTDESGNTNERPSRGRADAGQGLVEYALILVLVAVVSIGATLFLTGQLTGALTDVGNQLNGASGPSEVVSPTPTPTATPIPPSAYTKKKTCVAAGYTWVKKPKPAHCE